MQKYALECPRCGRPFEYACDGEFPTGITCPYCKQTCACSEYSAQCFCPECHAQLSMPLEMAGSNGMKCPECGRVVNDIAVKENDANGAIVRVSEHLLIDDAFFDKYRIVRFIGAGGMGEVYLAQHLIFGRTCALKIMKPHLYSGNKDYVKRFIREARICYKLDSPYIVKVYDTGRDAETGLLYIAMEYVEGENLTKILSRKSFTENEMREVGTFVARALADLQKHGIVHRDIKPANIIKEADGEYKLMDMGIARNIAGDENGIDGTMTMDNALIGTPNYESPEQCRSAHDVDTRSDIYSLGATLYHLATGRPPYTGSTVVEITLNVLEGNREPLKKLRGDLSPEFLNAVEMMMAPEPSRRPQTPGDVEKLLKPSHVRLGILSICLVAVIILLLGGCLAIGAGLLLRLSDNTPAEVKVENAVKQSTGTSKTAENVAHPAETP